MINAGQGFTSFRLPGNLKWLLLGWMVAEIAAFAIVIHLLGLGGAILLVLGTSVVGVTMMRRIGFDASRQLRQAFDGRQPTDGALLDGMLTALGAILLILPGFVSNIVGCALAAPSLRRWTAVRFDGRRVPPPAGARVKPKGAPDVIDLAPEDWRVVDRR